jgi:Tfp pilus assembly protein PilN
MRAVNLIPVDNRGRSTHGATRSHGGAYAVIGLLAGLALFALLYGSARHQISTRTSKAAALEAQVQQVQTNASKLAPYSSFIALREQRLQAVSQLVDSRFDWAHTFHELGRVLPPEASITSVTGTIAPAGGSASASSPPSSGGAVASTTPPGSVPNFTITGCALNQASVALTLERLRLMDGASSVTLQSSTSGAGATSTGSCPTGYPVFSVQIAFDALPAASATHASTVKSAGGA